MTRFGSISDQADRDRRHNYEGHGETLKPTQDQDVDQDHDNGKSATQISGDLIGNEPFPVPFHDRRLSVPWNIGRLSRIMDLGSKL